LYRLYEASAEGTEFWRATCVCAGIPEGHMRPLLTDIQVVRTAVSAWEYELRGENFVDGGGFTVMRTDALDELDPDSYYLMSQIKRYHWGRDQFVLTGEFAKKLGWNPKRFVKARRVLESRGHITVLHRRPGHWHSESIRLASEATDQVRVGSITTINII